MSRESIFQHFANEGKRLTQYVQSRIRSTNDMDAEDIVDEVMLQLLKVVGLSGQVSNLPAYVMRSLQYKIVDYYRMSNRTDSLDKPLNEEDTYTLMDQLVSAVNVEGDIETSEFLEALYEALDSLDPKQRAIFIATEIDGKSFKELSELWGEPIGTLLSRKSRTIKRLQSMLSEFNPRND